MNLNACSSRDSAAAAAAADAAADDAAANPSAAACRWSEEDKCALADELAAAHVVRRGERLTEVGVPW